MCKARTIIEHTLALAGPSPVTSPSQAHLGCTINYSTRVALEVDCMALIGHSVPVSQTTLPF